MHKADEGGNITVSCEGCGFLLGPTPELPPGWVTEGGYEKETKAWCHACKNRPGAPGVSPSPAARASRT